MLRIYMLGNFQVERDGIPIPAVDWARRKARSLLKLLALRRDTGCTGSRSPRCSGPTSTLPQPAATSIATCHSSATPLSPASNVPLALTI